MRVLVRCRDVSDATKAQILSLTAYRCAADRLPVLPVTADIRSRTFGMLTAACTAYSFIMVWAAVAACHNDFATVQGSIEGFQLVDQFGYNQSFMWLSTLATKLSCIEMRGKLGTTVIIFLEKFEKILEKHVKTGYNKIMERR